MKTVRARSLAGLIVLGVAAGLSLPAAAQVVLPGQPEALRAPFDAGATRHWPRSHAWDLENQKLEVSFDWDKKEVSGVTTLTLTPLVDGLSRLTLDAAEMTIEQATLAPPTAGQGNGQPLEFSYQGDELTLVLDHAYARGETLTVAVRYRARPRKGLYFRGPDSGYPDRKPQVWSQGETEYNHYWFPTYDSPNDKATSEVVVTVPAAMTVISNGVLVGVSEDKAAGTKTWDWREEVPHSTYLTSLVAGSYEKHAVASGAAAGGTDTPAVDVYVPPGTDDATVARSFALTPEMIQFYGDYTGIPYPYKQYAQTTVQDFLWGGMENISATTLTSHTLHDEATEPNETSEGLVAHELAHQWWGDLLTTRDWANIWLNEAFATFFTDLWHEHHQGADEYDYQRWLHMQDYFCEDRDGSGADCTSYKDHYRRPIVWPVYVAPMDLFDSTTYRKGAVVLSMLRHVVGDAAFRRAIHYYGTEFARQPVDTEDFRKAIAEATGQDLGWFFDEWAYHAGYPELHVESSWDDATHTAHLSVEQRQERTELTPLFRMPVDVEYVTSAGPQRFHLWIEHARDDFSFPLAERPTRVRFDPDQVLLKKIDFPRSRAELIDLLHNDANVIGRIWAAEQLARPGADPEALAALREALLKDPFYGVRAQVARLLGATRSPEARDALLAALKDDDARVREKAAEALGKFAGDAGVAHVLAGVAASDPKSHVAAAAVKALGEVGAPGAYEQLQAALQRDPKGGVVCQHALKGFAKLGDAKAVPLLLEWSAYGKPPQAREAAIEALGTVGRGNNRVYDALLALLNDPYVWAQRAAVRALGKLGDARAIAPLRAYAAGEVERRLQREAERSAEMLERAQSD